ncbi:hypothetical protein K493DRAFT_251484 [Basidiobolus meristosporus CBS 931.73]|uniref:Sugar phosphate transporter domain-containing protein n=1 Tax=Basidiobolus meristosporus CBS 931.73 TaxID=1314790 RepID=A0A1Y1Z9P6_9FUNG|nr:hypothetical protein K493DRAFT_251484 [Basidiobolus meristosporus CBS 931.73]|eukprot:ORY06979.1 hypothetical protein K493DRAFT_251484 [Basidiobolus meristosporus CBS 931.73]
MTTDGTKAPENGDRKLVAFSVSFYIVTALVMVMANKWVLNAVSVPVTFLWAQIALAVIFFHLSSLFNLFVIPKLNLKTCVALAPLITINVIGLTFNTLCLQYLDASFYQVARALVLPFTVVLSWVVLKKKSSLMVILACAIVCSGFFVGVAGEMVVFNVSLTGILFGVISSVTTATHAIVIKKSLEVVNNNTMELVYYNNILSAFALVPVIFLNSEVQGLYALFGSEENTVHIRTFIIGALVTGFFGFLINIAGFLQIKVTSPVTHMISSAVRGVLQTILAVYCFGDILTGSRVSGITLILAGSCFYTYIKDLESKQEEANRSKDGYEKV